MYKISYEDFLDKVHGCWYGKCLGGAAGAPVEGIKDIIDKDFREIFDPDLPNDDLDLQLLWIDVLEKKGINITSEDLAEAWKEKCWYPFSEYGYFLKNSMRGIKAPYSGIINNSFFKEGMGCPIRSEIWGIIGVGNPELAAKYAYLDATLDHADNSVFAEQFLAAAESLAFFEDDMSELVSKSLNYIPKDSKLAKCFFKVIEYFNSGKTALEARAMILSEFSHPDFTNVTQNLGFVLIALLYGEKDMAKTINLALMCGYDTDCTCASAASIVGIMNGYNGLDKELRGLIKDYFVCGIDVFRPTDSIKDLAVDTVKIAMSIENNCVEITGCENIKKTKPEILIEYATEEGLEKAKKQLKPLHWQVYGPYFEQLHIEDDGKYPSPHGEGSVLPPIVCMVNSEVFLEKEYIDEVNLDFESLSPICEIDAYEDLVPVDENLTMEGQMCCYARCVLNAPEDMKVWAVIGNTDGFKLWVNKKEVLSKDEIRLYTPYNNFELIDLKKGKNEITLKLLRRTDKMKFAIGFRIYDGVNHWHRTKWHTDLV